MTDWRQDLATLDDAGRCDWRCVADQHHVPDCETPQKQEAIARIRARLEAAEREWRPIGTEPKDGTEFLAYREDAGVFSALWAHPLTEDGEEDSDVTEMFTSRGEDLTGDYPTLWMPMPTPPDSAALAAWAEAGRGT